MPKQSLKLFIDPLKYIQMFNALKIFIALIHSTIRVLHWPADLSLDVV